MNDGSMVPRPVTREQFLRRGAAVVASGTLLSGVLAACGNDASSTASDGGSAPPAKATGTLKMGFPALPASLDPGKALSIGDFAFAATVFDPLVRFDDAYEQIEGALVERWEFSDDARVWTGRLRQGVTFHDGSPLDSSVIKANLVYQKGAAGVAAGLIPEFRTIDDSNPEVIRLVTKEPAPDLTRNLTYIYMISGALIKQGEKAIAAKPAGTGAFRFVSNSGSTIKFVANDHFWGRGPYVAAVELSAVPDVATRVAALQTGELHVIPQLAPAQAEQLKSDARVKLVPQDVWAVRYLAFHVNNPAVHDVRVRKAVFHALDRDALAKSVLRGMATAAEGYQPKGTYGQSAMTPTYPHDVAKAKALLTEVGGAPSLRVASVAGFNDQLDQAIVGQLEAVGFRVRLDPLEEPVFTKEQPNTSSPYDVFISSHGWSNGGPATYYLRLLTTFSNYAQGESKAHVARAEQLADAIAQTPDGPQRLAVIGQLQTLFAETLPYIPTFYAQEIYGISSKLRGFTPSRNNKASTIRNAYFA